MSFGRKGVAPGQGAASAPRPAARPVPRPAAPVDPEAAEIAARREAFLAAERARRAEDSDAGDALAGLRNAPRPARPRSESVGDSWNPMSQDALRAARGSGRSDFSPASSGSSILGDPRKRTVMMAYVYWYFCAPIGLHRIYCGHKESGLCQMALFFGGIVLAMIWLPLGVVSIIVWLLWVIADMFLIPGMMRRYKAQHQPDYGAIFA